MDFAFFRGSPGAAAGNAMPASARAAGMATKPKRVPTVAPMLWFDQDLEDAIAYYKRIFPGVVVQGIQRGPDGKAFTARFSIGGQQFTGLNAGPMFKFNEAVSFVVPCKDQAEVDYYWDALTADGGEESNCGWLKDKHGLSWQVIPDALPECLGDPDPVKSGRAMQAMLGMRKLDVQALYDARDGKATKATLGATKKGARTAREIGKDVASVRGLDKPVALKPAKKR